MAKQKNNIILKVLVFVFVLLVTFTGVTALNITSPIKGNNYTNSINITWTNATNNTDYIVLFDGSTSINFEKQLNMTSYLINSTKTTSSTYVKVYTINVENYKYVKELNTSLYGGSAGTAFMLLEFEYTDGLKTNTSSVNSSSNITGTNFSIKNPDYAKSVDKINIWLKDLGGGIAYENRGDLTGSNRTWISEKREYVFTGISVGEHNISVQGWNDSLKLEESTNLFNITKNATLNVTLISTYNNGLVGSSNLTLYNYNTLSSENYSSSTGNYTNIGIIQGNMYLLTAMSTDYIQETYILNAVNPYDSVQINMSQEALVLYFVNMTGSAKQISGIISDETPMTTSFNNTSILIKKSSFAEGKVNVMYNTIVSGIILKNWTQYYEYENTGNEFINETIGIINISNQTELWSTYLQVYDHANSPIENAIVRYYGVTGELNKNNTGYLLGQRLTDDEGETFLIAEKIQQLFIVVSKDGYDLKKLLISNGDYTYTSSSPLKIILKPNSTTVKYNAVMYLPSVIYNKSESISGQIQAKSYSSIRLTTDFRQSIGLPYRDYSNSSYVYNMIPIVLYPNLDYDENTASNISVLVYLDYDLWANVSIEYQPPSEINKIFPTDSSTSSLRTKVGAIVEAIGLLLMVMFMSLVFKDNRMGFHTFMIGLLVLAIVNPNYYIYTGVVSALYYVMRLINYLRGD